MKNIFELANEEREAKNYRINQVLCNGIPRGTNRETRAIIAQGLYNARYGGHHYQDEVRPEEILENFCWNIFGASCEEVLEAWDKFLD